MKLTAIILNVIITAIFLSGCYTRVELPKHTTTNKTYNDPERKVSFTYSVIDTFDNAWLPDEGYYYEFRFDFRRIKEDKIDLFLNMLYAKGYNITGAWYRPAIDECLDGPFTDFNPNRNILPPKFLILLSDFDDSIIEHNFYAVMNKPIIPCPYDVEEYWIE